LKPSVTAPSAPSARYRFDWRQTFAALKYPNYRLWFIGQLVSLAGTWMQSAAQGYLIYQITRSPVYLGYVSFSSGIPTWLFTLYGGVIADRMSRRALMIITQTSMMILAFILAAVHGNETINGLLLSVRGVGALLGASVLLVSAVLLCVFIFACAGWSRLGMEKAER
jgi:nitrate/nitrite transporter NarK